MLERWRERDVFHESIRRREGARAVRLLRGAADRQRPPRLPPRARARVQGRLPALTRRCAATWSTARRGWDCHGLPVELEIEKELGFKSKEDIERYGVAEFNAKCRESVLRYIDEWNALTERIGFWIDTDDAYFTLDDDYIESVWWSLKQVWEKGLLYEGHKVVPYCPRCGTALSSHEVALGYKDVVDPSRLRPASRCADEPGRLAAGLDDHALDARARTRRSRSIPTSPTCAPASATRR